ncbi:MAG: hypothetical protein K2X80_16750 [Pseudomonadaceae bacterium]|nr:hypothetical protein [Pseudomonadaceae bacterium]
MTWNSPSFGEGCWRAPGLTGAIATIRDGPTAADDGKQKRANGSHSKSADNRVERDLSLNSMR